MVLLIFACATGGDGSDAGFVIAIGVFDWLWFSGVMGLEVCVHGNARGYWRKNEDWLVLTWRLGFGVMVRVWG